MMSCKDTPWCWRMASQLIMDLLKASIFIICLPILGHCDPIPEKTYQRGLPVFTHFCKENTQYRQNTQTNFKKSIKMTHIWTSKPISSLIQIERWKKAPLTYLYFLTTLFWIQNRKSSELMLNRRQLWIFIQQAVKSKIIWIVFQVLQNWLHSELWGSWENSQSFLLRFIRIRRIWGKV